MIQNLSEPVSFVNQNIPYESLAMFSVGFFSVHEDQTIQESIIKRNSHLVLEMGSPPKNNEVIESRSLNS